MRKDNKKGFTLAELLIVVAIIAVLVAISIPIFTSQLEKSREATDLANVRAAYAEVMAAVISEDADATYQGQIIKNGDLYTAQVPLKQKAGWVTDQNKIEVGGCTYANGGMVNVPGSLCTISCDASKEENQVLIDWGGEAGAAPSYNFSIEGAWQWDAEKKTITYKPNAKASTWQHTSVNELLDVKGDDKSVTFRMPSKEEAAGYLDPNYDYRVGLFYVDANNVGQDKYTVYQDKNSPTLQWGKDTTFTYTGTDNADKSMKAVVQFFKKDPNVSSAEGGGFEYMTEREVNYLMSLYQK